MHGGWRKRELHLFFSQIPWGGIFAAFEPRESLPRDFCMSEILFADQCGYLKKAELAFQFCHSNCTGNLSAISKFILNCFFFSFKNLPLKQCIFLYPLEWLKYTYRGVVCLHTHTNKAYSLVACALTSIVCITISLLLRLDCVTAVAPHPLNPMTKVSFKLVWLLRQCSCVEMLQF